MRSYLRSILRDFEADKSLQLIGHVAEFEFDRLGTAFSHTTPQRRRRANSTNGMVGIKLATGDIQFCVFANSARHPLEVLKMFFSTGKKYSVDFAITFYRPKQPSSLSSVSLHLSIIHWFLGEHEAKKQIRISHYIPNRILCRDWKAADQDIGPRI